MATKIFPITNMSNVYDEDTGNNLYQYLANVNHYNIGLVPDANYARSSLSIPRRRTGVYITYHTDSAIITEVFVGKTALVEDDTYFTDNANWRTLLYVASSTGGVNTKYN